MNLAEEAFNRLLPKKINNYIFSIKYSAKFKDYNANIRLSNNNLQLNLSKKWRNVNKEITIGLIQSLLLRLLKEKKKTTNINLYNNFMKSLHISIPKTKTDPILEQSFNRINEKYFNNIIESTNLTWSHVSKRKLGSYEYGTDTILINSMLKDTDQDILDYIMYHEMLHKKHKFSTSKGGRNLYHSTKFRKYEKQFENQDKIERKLKTLHLTTPPKKNKNLVWD